MTTSHVSWKSLPEIQRCKSIEVPIHFTGSIAFWNRQPDKVKWGEISHQWASQQNAAQFNDHQRLPVDPPELQKWEMSSFFSHSEDSDISWKLWAGVCYFRRKYLQVGSNHVFRLPNPFRCKNVSWPFWESCSSPFVHGKPLEIEQIEHLGNREVSFPPLACFCSALAKAHAHLSPPFPASLHKMAESKALDGAGRTTWLNNSQLRKVCCFFPSLSSWPCSSSGLFYASTGTVTLCPNSQTLQKTVAAPGNETIQFKACGTASMRTELLQVARKMEEREWDQRERKSSFSVLLWSILAIWEAVFPGFILLGAVEARIFSRELDRQIQAECLDNFFCSNTWTQCTSSEKELSLSYVVSCSIVL